jgi:hypothetical protein
VGLLSSGLDVDDLSICGFQDVCNCLVFERQWCIVLCFLICVPDQSSQSASTNLRLVKARQ